MNILVLYNATQTYTNAVFEHLQAFEKFSEHEYFFMHISDKSTLQLNLTRFDAVCVHFSIRLPFDQIPDPVAEVLQAYGGIKFLFIQDEYDNTRHVWAWIHRLKFDIIFTVVPERSISLVYPPEQFPGTTFVSNLTGYVPTKPSIKIDLAPPSGRTLIVGYRGRRLPLRYGMLGIEKAKIGMMVQEYCVSRGIRHDIAWEERNRIYGERWVEFIFSCRAMLGTESGSNIFDWDGDIDKRLADYKTQHPNATDDQIYEEILSGLEQRGLMNQISPKVFEAIAARTVLVLFEGEYSGVLVPDEHYISLKKDGSNIAEVFRILEDGKRIDQMADKAYKDIIDSGLYNYSTFIKKVDGILSHARDKLLSVRVNDAISVNSNISPEFVTTSPIRSAGHAIGSPMRKYIFWSEGTLKIIFPLGALWSRLPTSIRTIFLPLARFIRDKIT